MANCIVYFNEELIKIHTNMVYEAGPIEFANSDVQVYPRKNLEPFLKMFLKMLKFPGIKISNSVNKTS